MLSHTPKNKIYIESIGDLESSIVLGQVMALASFSLWDHLAFVGLRFPAAESFTPFTEWRPRKELQMFNHLAMDA